ncbi:hypothetical protein [Streptomyces ochraceiscleroticus]|uniref:hypothetical protein n=1 Tax=Streptomyces ochraceiscleroticus TaxID=47761 RepID=UPI0004C55B43|nr:hypothetical protein [Streptomyces ochraceiscleroticus]
MTRKNEQGENGRSAAKGAGRGDPRDRDTAAKEVLAEFEDAETRVAGPDERRHVAGESGDPLTTSLDAQESLDEAGRAEAGTDPDQRDQRPPRAKRQKAARPEED